MNKTERLKKVIELINNQYSCIKDMEICKEGNNSQVFKLIHEGGEKHALKLFPEKKREDHRLKREVLFLNFLRKINYRNCPLIKTCDEKLNFILLSWIEGEKVKRPLINDFHEFTYFYQILNKNKNFGSNIPSASEAIFTLSKLYDHISNLIYGYEFIFKKESKNFEIEFKIIKHLKTDLYFAKQTLSNKQKKEINFSDYKILSQSDIGFHNILKNNSKLYFIDFEYAGWDSPMKLYSDFILQPSGYYTFKKPVTFFTKILREIIYTRHIKDELYEYLLLYRLRWILIKLNLLRNKVTNTRCNEKKILDDTINYSKSSLNYIDQNKENFF